MIFGILEKYAYEADLKITALPTERVLALNNEKLYRS